MKKFSETEGIYKTNQFCISISKEKSIFLYGKTNDRCLPTIIDNSNLHKLGTFIHEYFHYINNITTFSGFLFFDKFVELLTYFSKTINENGQSDSSIIITSNDYTFFKESINYIDSLNGYCEIIDNGLGYRKGNTQKIS